MRHVAVVGGGPSGLHAAAILASAGLRVSLYEGKPSVGRKFLVAGRGGLNLTHSEDQARFVTRYRGSFREGFWTSLLRDFGNKELRKWAHGLGVETFLGSSGRVFPREFQSAHLLRRWLKGLKERGVVVLPRHRWEMIELLDNLLVLDFLTPEGRRRESHDAVILSLGGASWPQTGSDASWIYPLERLGLRITPFSPANCGWEVPWKRELLPLIEGHPLKNIAVTAGGTTVTGELLITRYGLEGGALYRLGNTLRGMGKPLLHIDLKPSLSVGELAAKIPQGQGEVLAVANKAWRLSPAAAALLSLLADAETLHSARLLAERTKSLPIHLTGPRPIAEAISSAGGVSFDEVDEFLMVRKHPGLFLAGEMLDWEAPTGGYLLQGCFATGQRAALGVLKYLSCPRGAVAGSAP